jgi:hypothetical protein
MDAIDLIDAIIDGKRSVSSLNSREATAVLQFYEEQIEIHKKGGPEAMLAPPREGIRKMMQILSGLANCGNTGVERRYRKLAGELSLPVSAASSSNRSLGIFVVIIALIVAAVIGYIAFN